MANLFKAYDIRGTYPEPLSPDFAFALGHALVDVFAPKSCVIGRDARLSGPFLQDALACALEARKVKSAFLGQCGTEEIYHAAANGDYDLGIMITGSHNPANENGFKLVRRGAIPIGHDSGLRDLEAATARVLANPPGRATTGCEGEFPANSGQVAEDLRSAYLEWLVDYAGMRGQTGRPLRVAVDAGNGCAGLLLQKLAELIPHELIPLNWQPDGNFPNGVPNPLLPSKRRATSQAVIAAGADLGVAFDGDFDRCFFYDARGNFIESYYLVGILAADLLKKHPGEKIVHDPRVYWNTREMVKNAGGIPIMGKTGHAYMKEKMRAENALYGGEMSAHHYFRDFAFCDSGMLAMLLVLSFLQNSSTSLEGILEERMRAYPCSGELNFRAENAPELMELACQKYGPKATSIDRLDGINLEMPSWRFNLRSSNTEPLLRLNVESRGDRPLMEDMTAAIAALLRASGAEKGAE